MFSLQLALAKMAVLVLSLQIAYAAVSGPAIYPVTPPPAHELTAGQIYAQVPVLRSIAACESTGDVSGTPRQFKADGGILWGQENDPVTGKTITVKRDCGEGQINTKAHGRYPNGLDVCGNEDDNVNEMLILYRQLGTEPWNASRDTCWGKVVDSQ